MNKEINNILAIIANRSFEKGITLDDLSEITKTNKNVLNENLKLLSDNPEMYLDYIPYKEGNKWKIDWDNKDCYILSLDAIEKGIFDITLNDNKNNLNLISKSLYGKSNGEKYIEIIGAAIMQKKIIKATYNKISMYIQPLKLVYYEFENIFYLMGQYEKKLMVYNLEKIENVKITKESFKDDLNIDLEEYLSTIWGMEQNAKATLVKVKFKKEVNVEDKVKRDLEFRKHKRITDYKDYFIYEDEIIGINSFKSWLRSFGSSAILLSPEYIKNEMISSAEAALKQYK